MKKLLLFLVTLILFTNCSKDDNIKNKNPYLPNYPVNLTINLDLPSYVELQYVSNYKYIGSAGSGIKGIIVFNNGNGYHAFDASCPNLYPADCERMTVTGIKAICECDNSEYSLFTGLGNLQYPLKQYRTELNGTILKIYN